MALEDHRFLRRHRQRPRRARARPPARLLGRRALARLRSPLLRRRARAEGGRGAARPRRRIGRRSGHAASTSSSTPAPASASTELAESESADVIVFGSEYRTAPGTVKPGISAHKLLLGGPAAIAVAPAGLRDNPSVSINTVGVIDEGDAAARQTAESLAAALGATRRRARRRPGRPARRRFAPGVPAGQGDAQRRQRLRGRGRQLPGAGRPARASALSFGSPRPEAPAAARSLTTRITAATSGSRPSIRLLRLGPVERRGARRLAAAASDRLVDGLASTAKASAPVAVAPPRPPAALGGSRPRRSARVRPALAEGEVRALEARLPRGPSACSRAVRHSRSPSSIVWSVTQG